MNDVSIEFERFELAARYFHRIRLVMREHAHPDWPLDHVNADDHGGFMAIGSEPSDFKFTLGGRSYLLVETFDGDRVLESWENVMREWGDPEGPHQWARIDSGFHPN